MTILALDRPPTTSRACRPAADTKCDHAYGAFMTSLQTPISSGFGMRSEPSDILEGVNLAGKNVVVTGGYSGLGLETSRALAAAGATITAPARRPDHARQVLADESLGSVTVAEMDLADLASVEAFANTMLEAGTPIDIMIDNAAVMACPEAHVGDGWESQFGTNHIGHFALVNRLWPLIAAAGTNEGARVVSLSSTGHKLSPIRWDDIHFTSGDYDKWVAYGQAKTANALFAVQLDRFGESAGVRTFAVHPGGIMTPLQRHLPQEEMIAMGWVDADGKVNELFKSPSQGATTTLWTATSSQLNGMGGVYCEDCDVSKVPDPSDPMARYFGVAEHAIDHEQAERLWALSAEMTGVNAFA
ncbi:MAG: NAD(P)-dependent dehydrogenase (short-subunit alcohol dehydrogenase family) [Ilumatobacter sp.]|jgi:NAD(P)-dependent dehydrogenase (short-subunit alcohol dehydrogenase family)